MRNLFMSFLQFTLFLLVLEGRHLAHDIGGRLLTVVFTTITGALTGVLFAYNQSRALG